MQTRLLLLTVGLSAAPAVGLAVGCTPSRAESIVPMDPGEAVAELRLALDDLAAASDDAAARAAWKRAHAAFARGLEQPVRAGCGHRSATELEYAFARLGASTDPDVRHERAAALLDALERRVACL